MLKSSIIGCFAGANILIGFLYQWYIIITLGPGVETDALIAGMMVPQLVFAVVSGSFSPVLVPLLTTLDKEKFGRAAWGFFFCAVLLSFGLGCTLYALAHLWVPLIVPGFQHDVIVLAISLARIQLIGMVFSVLSTVLWAVARAKEQFIRGEISALVANLLVFWFLVWGLPRIGVVAAAWALALRMILQSFILIPVLGAFARPSLSDKVFLDAARRFKPILTGAIYYKTDPFVDRFLASMAPVGSMTLLHLAQQIYNAANTLLSRAIVNPMVPMQSRRYYNNKHNEFFRIYKKYLKAFGVLIFGGFFLLFLIGEPVLAMLFGHNRFDPDSIESLWLILVLLGGLWIGGGLGAITSSTYYAKGDTFTPTKLGIRTFNVYLPFKLLMFYLYGIKGLAVSISFFYLINFSLQAYYLKKKEVC